MADLMTIPKNLPICETVGELVDILQTLPRDLDIRCAFDVGVKPVIFNRTTDPFLRLEDNDGTWDED